MWPPDSGRNAIAMARAGMRVVAADFSEVAMRQARGNRAREELPIWPVVADFEEFALPSDSFDAIINVNFLDRALFPRLERALRPGGILLAETFLIDQADDSVIRETRASCCSTTNCARCCPGSNCFAIARAWSFTPMAPVHGARALVARRR